jgi:hypothetical protein
MGTPQSRDQGISANILKADEIDVAMFLLRPPA